MKKLENVREIIQNYDNFIIDLWGVVHNGVNTNPGALKVIDELYKKKKKFTFLSNAPRPVSDVREFLIKKMKIKSKFLSNILTSGEAAILSLKKFEYGKFFFHLGPDRDHKIYQGYEKYKTSILKCEYILCTGLYDHEMKNLSYYEKLLLGSEKKTMICTNPDLIVDRGNEQEYCAGTIAKIFEKIGGKVIYFGKPYKEIYDLLINKTEKVLIIGDNLRTDIKGANYLKKDSLFIMNGVHKNEIKKFKNLETFFEKYNIKPNFIQNDLNW